MVDMIGLLSQGIAMPEITNWIGMMINGLYEFIGNYGWTVVLFTVILKVALSPLDIWQKVVTRRNTKTMEIMKPELDKLKKQYGSNQQQFAEKQMALFKKHKYSMFSACVPSLITMAIFFIVFSGFNATIRYQNELMFFNLNNAFISGYNGLMGGDAVVAFYEANSFDFLWINNIFMPDTWSTIIPDWDTFTGTGIGSFRINLGIESNQYYEIMNPLIESTGDKWNGLLILPALSMIFNVISQRFMMKSQQASTPVTGGEDMQKATQMNMKVMLWMMPIMMVGMSIFYSSAFTLYMFISSLITTIFQVVTTLVFKQKDKKEAELKKKETFVR